MGSDHDKWLHAMLRQEPAKASEVCLDADTIASWAGGSLTGKELAAAELHASTCSRCMAILAATERSAPPATGVSKQPWILVTPMRWLVPLTAAAPLWPSGLPSRSAGHGTDNRRHRLAANDQCGAREDSRRAACGGSQNPLNRTPRSHQQVNLKVRIQVAGRRRVPSGARRERGRAVREERRCSCAVSSGTDAPAGRGGIGAGSSAGSSRSSARAGT